MSGLPTPPPRPGTPAPTTKPVGLKDVKKVTDPMKKVSNAIAFYGSSKEPTSSVNNPNHNIIKNESSGIMLLLNAANGDAKQLINREAKIQEKFVKLKAAVNDFIANPASPKDKSAELKQELKNAETEWKNLRTALGLK
jgi:hypothetical protein